MESVERAEPRVAVIMGSDSDWSMMQGAGQALEEFGVPWEARVVSAHRTPENMVEYARAAAKPWDYVIVAEAGGAAHLPGMVASLTPLPVIGVPVAITKLDRMDALLSIVQMPAGVPVATVAVDGARNAGLLACGSSGGRSLRTGRASSDYGTIGGLLWPVGRRHRSGIAGPRYALAGVVLRLSTVANACECITCRRVIGRPRLGGHPRPGSTSMSDDVTISPHFPQRSSICVTLPHARWRRRTGGPASPAVQRSPHWAMTISASTNSKPLPRASSETRSPE